MPSPPHPPQSTRLENLSLDAQGAAFDLEGRPVRLKAEGYAGPVASMREFYQQALSDYYQRSAELSRQAAASRPPLLRRMLSWIGRIFDRITPGARAEAAGSPPFLVPRPAESPPPAPPRGQAGAGAPQAADPAPVIASGTERMQKPEAKRRGPTPPLLQVVFADQNGVHVIWHLPTAKGEPGPQGRGAAHPTASPPRLELTYGLDSTMAQRLQDCYGQLAQLGYRIAGLDRVRANPGKSASEKLTPKPVATASPPGIKPVAAEKLPSEPARAAEPTPMPRKARSKPEAGATPPEPPRADPEPPNPSFLPGL